MKIYNTLTNKKQEFVPIEDGKAKIYACGPTVYNYIHVGNSRPICVFDVLRRYLEYMGYDVTFVQNFTDIDDKIIKKATEEKSDFMTVSRKYIDEYKKDAAGLNVREATIHPKATENIDEIIKIISELIKKGHAYAAENGDVYFSTRSFKEYGKLSGQTIDDLQSGARIKVGEIKKDPLDFALWKAAKEGEPYWESPWGKGRPGWHIECSAMAGKYLGKTIDIHCGGQDLIFPHHENEIAQSEGCNGVDFAHYWMHNGYINVNSQKMSKSLGNFFTVREIAEKYGYEPIRYLMIASHYRSPINFSEEIIMQCKSALERLYKFRENLEFAVKNAAESAGKIEFDIASYKNKFIEKMNDDLNTADALGVIFELVKNVNMNIIPKSGIAGKALLSGILELFNELTGVLGILYEDKTQGQKSISEDEIKELIDKRNLARKEKNWQRADEIRDELKSKNVIIEDTPQGTKYTIK
ncbi:MAG: cysteine--tRNA ligase [Clostridia bacterium]|nr:cysteine--tRNA ligase [Clostridia bacterium]